ncbi:MAG TPA: AAA family ATPase, partial [Chloroflexota bacterium]
MARPVAEPTAFCGGRYQVKQFLGEGGKKRVYLVHDGQLDRDVAFALLKSEGLDLDGLVRMRREAQAMGRLGDHPNVVTVHDIGDENGQPYIVSQYMAGGSLQSVIEQAEDHRLALDRALEIAAAISRALEHAHAHGVIHRDLKPGNVFLAAGLPAKRDTSLDPSSESTPRTLGTAKLGDFGLATAVDRSRLTQAGMVVGTASYMSPEQATGGEVTARSDLYSLGCLLYELVVGHPPFVGDETVAIISQHLHAPPVAPSWHRPDCPPGLEALILRLLEKDPAKRPQSAAEVREALTAVSPSPQPSPARGEGVLAPAAGGLDPVYRQAFVGREQELGQLQAAFDAALSGQGALVAVVGEPGIGKTALCEQLATYAAVRGGKTLVGHCYEEGSLSLPYLAFVEALRTYVLDQEPGRLKEQLGTGASEVARIVSEVRDRASVEPRQAAGDPEEDRWRLLQAVTNFLRSASTVQPLLLVLEDLHWADRGSLDLLLHMARSLTGSRLLVVGTYRDAEVERGHPLSNTLAELRRNTAFARIPLRGLTVDEVHRMMNIIRGQEVPWSRAEAIHRQTEGNPLFVQEVLRYIVESGQLVRQGDRYVRVDGGDPDTGIPEGLRDVIGKRLSHLSEKTNQLLAIAAVIGREFRLDVLQQVAGPSTGSVQGLSVDEIDTALQEATERAVVDERPATGVLAFRFTHAFFRQTLYEEIFASRRLRLHQQVARGLETIYARRLEEHASELAEHFAQSTDSADLEKALHYSELAAQRSSQVFA